MSLLPSSPDITPDSEPRVVGLDTEEADDLMAALSSGTARRLLAELHEDPAPPGRLAERADTSLQNAQYHLEKLESAGAVEVVGTAYSEKGREMQVYGPSDSPLVIFAGEQERASGLRAAVSRLFGGFAALAGGALVVQELFGRSILRLTGDDAAPPAGGPDGDGAGGATATPTAGDGGGAATPDAAPGATSSGGADAEATDGPSTPADDAGDGGGAETPAETPEHEGTPTSAADAEAGSYGADTTPTGTETPTEVGETPVADGAWDLDMPGVFEGFLGSGMPPGLAFFLGGATVLTFLVAMTYVRAQP